MSPMPLNCELTHRLPLRMGLLSVLIVTLAGCGAEKESTHAHTHSEPKHWPTSLGEAADYIDSRIQSLVSSGEQDSEVVDELKDLIEWTPQIAADTDLPEDDWIPIYELSEAIRLHLLPGDVDPLLIESDFDRLCNLLRDANVTVDSLQQQAFSAFIPDDLEVETDTAAEGTSPQN